MVNWETIIAIEGFDIAKNVAKIQSVPLTLKEVISEGYYKLVREGKILAVSHSSNIIDFWIEDVHLLQVDIDFALVRFKNGNYGFISYYEGVDLIDNYFEYVKITEEEAKKYD